MYYMYYCLHQVTSNKGRLQMSKPSHIAYVVNNRRTTDAKGLLASGRCRMAAQERRRVRCRDLPTIARCRAGSFAPCRKTTRRKYPRSRSNEVGAGVRKHLCPFFVHQSKAIRKGEQAMKITIASATKAKFDLGAGCQHAGRSQSLFNDHLTACLARHVSGDWGVVCADDAATNEEALKEGLRLLSAYPIDPAKPSKGWGENTLWIITEADRSVTTFLCQRVLRRKGRGWLDWLPLLSVNRWRDKKAG